MPAVLLVALAALCGVALAGSIRHAAPARSAQLRAFTAGPLERIRATDGERTLVPVALWAARG